jgi:hypothetical protein
MRRIILEYLLLAGIAASLGAAPADDAGAGPAPALELLVYDRANVSSGLLAQAQRRVEEVYADIGVRIVWVSPDAPLTTALRLTLVLIPYGGETFFLHGPEVMGTAVGHDGSGARRAYISLLRIEQIMPRSAEIDQPFVIGCVIAHEIGHLLLPAHPHSSKGIMRGVFRIYDFAPNGSTDLRFTAEQAEHIRRVVHQVASRTP